jgi:hypothetical protein
LGEWKIEITRTLSGAIHYADPIMTTVSAEPGREGVQQINKPGDLPLTKDVWNFPDKVPANDECFSFFTRSIGIAICCRTAFLTF